MEIWREHLGAKGVKELGKTQTHQNQSRYSHDIKSTWANLLKLNELTQSKLDKSNKIKHL